MQQFESVQESTVSDGGPLVGSARTTISTLFPAVCPGDCSQVYA